MSTRRVALIGAGLAGRVFHAPFIARSPHFELRHIVTSKPDRRLQILNALKLSQLDPSTLDDALNDSQVEVIVIATPNTSHASIAKRALEAGKHVIVDKPFALSREEAASIYAVADQADRQALVFHNRRFDSDFATMRRLLESGEAGEVHEVGMYFDRYVEAPKGGWRNDPNEPGCGIVFDLAPHLADQALALFGIPADFEIDVQSQRAQVPDYFKVVLHYDQAPRRVTLRAGQWFVDHALKYEVHGSDGSWRCFGEDPQEAELKGLYDASVTTPSPLLAELRSRGQHGAQDWPIVEGAGYLEFYRQAHLAMEGLPSSLSSREEILWIQGLLDASVDL